MLKDDLLRTRAVVRHLVGTGTDRAHVKGCRVCLGCSLGDHLDDADALSHQRVRELRLDRHRLVILRTDRVNEGDELGVERVVVRVEDALEGEDDVVGGHRVAVREDGSLTQGNLVGGVIYLGRQVRAKGGIDLARGRVELGESFHGVPVRRHSQGGGGRHGVVAVRAQLVGDSRLDDTVRIGLGGGGLLLRGRAARTGGRGAGATAGRQCGGQACGHTERRGQLKKTAAGRTGSRDRH